MFISLIGKLPYKCSQEGCMGKIGAFYDVGVNEEGDERVVGMCTTCEFASWYIISIKQIVSSIGLAREKEEELRDQFKKLGEDDAKQ